MEYDDLFSQALTELEQEEGGGLTKAMPMDHDALWETALGELSMEEPDRELSSYPAQVPEQTQRTQSVMQSAQEKGDLSWGEAIGGGLKEGAKDIARSHASTWLGTMRGWKKGVVDSLREDGYADEDIAGYLQGGELPDRETDGIVDWVRERFQQLGVPRSTYQTAEFQEQRTLENSALADPRMARDLEFEFRKENTGGLKGFGSDVSRVVPQVGGQIATYAAGGPLLSSLNIMSNITGMDYERNLEQGVSAEKAFNAAFWDAVMQTPLEQIGTGKIVDSMRGVIGKRLRKIAEAGLTEGLTEYLQAYPEKFTELFAKAPDARTLTEVNGFLDAVADSGFQNDALYQGAVGAVAGGGPVSVSQGLGSAMNLLTGEQEQHRTTENTAPVADWKEVEPLGLPTPAGALPAAPIAQDTERTGYGPIPQDRVRSAMEMPEGGPAPAALPVGSEPIPMGQYSEPIEVYGPNFEIVENQGKNYRPDFEMVQGGVPAVRQTSAMEPAQAPVQPQQATQDRSGGYLPSEPAMSSQGRPLGEALIEDMGSEPIQAQPTDVSLKANEAATSPTNDRPNPTEGQKEAGNYRKGHVRALGMDISIENPAGSERSGNDKDGKPWSVQMQHHYGYIKGTEGRDKDHLDVFLKDGVEAQDMGDKPVFVVDQVNGDGSFDEHKILMGFDNAKDAEAGYLSNYEQGWQGMGAITEMSPLDFKRWTKKSRKTKQPVAYVAPETAQKTPSPEQKSTESSMNRHEMAGVNVKSDGKPYSRKAIRLVVQQKIKGGMNVEEVQLDDAGKKWGWREVVDEGPAMDKNAQAEIKDKILKAVPSRDYGAMMDHADTLIDDEGYSVDDVYEVVNQIEEDGGQVVDEGVLEDVDLLRQHGDRWQYKFSIDSKWMTANTKKDAVERASEAYHKTPPEKRLTRSQRDQKADAEDIARSERLYGRMSLGELEQKHEAMGGDIAALRKAGKNEFDGNGGRRTGAAVANEGAKDVAEERMRLGRYIEHRKTKDEGIPNHISEDLGPKDTESIPVWEPEWTELDGQNVLHIPGSKWSAVPNNGKKVSKVWTAFNVETLEEGPQLKQNEVSKWLADAANGEDVKKNSSVEVKKLPEEKPNPKIKTPQVEPVKADSKEELDSLNKEKPERETPSIDLPISISLDDVDRDKAYHAYMAISHTPDRRADEEQRGYVEHMTGVVKEMQSVAKNDEQKAMLPRLLEEYKEGYLRKLNALLGAKSRTMSPMVTGPARFPVARNNKRMETERKRLNELLDWDKKAQRRMHNRLDGAKTGEEIQGEILDKLKAKVDHALGVIKEIKTGEMRGFNPSNFKSNLLGMFKRQAANGEAHAVGEALKYLDAEQKRLGIRAFTPKHQIWKLAEKAESVQTVQEETAKSGEDVVAVFDGAKIVNNHEVERVQILFDEIPSNELRTALKSSGWRWSRKHMAWQRKNTVNAIASAERIVSESYDKPEVSGSAQPETGVESEISDAKEKANEHEENAPGRSQGVEGREEKRDASAVESGREDDTVSERGTGSTPGRSGERGRSSSVRGTDEEARTSREYGKIPEKNARGNRTRVPYRVGEEIREDEARYEIRELSDVIPSHDPTDSFKPREDYPPKVQERVYHSDKEEQSKVKGNAVRFNPAYLVTNNPDASNGAPIITENGLVLGGNGRTMTLQVVYESYPQHAEKYVSELKDNASIFGLTTEAVGGFKQPVLVRVVDVADTSPKELLKKSRIYNQNVTGGMGKMAQSVSLGNLISEQTLAELALDLSRHGDMTFSEYLSQDVSRRIVQMLEDDGVLDTTKRNEYWDQKYKVLNPDGKSIVTNAFRGLVFSNPNTLERAPKRIVNKMDRILPALARLSRDNRYDMSSLLQDVLDMFIEFEQAKRTNSAIKTVQDYLTKYVSMVPARGKGNPVAEDWMLTMDRVPAKRISERLHQYADSMPKGSKDAYGEGAGLPGVKLDAAKERAKVNEAERQEREFGEATNDLTNEAKGKGPAKARQITMFSRADAPAKGMKVKSVTLIVSGLQDAAKRALPLKVVKSFSDLPQHVQDEARRKGSGYVEAANDGKTVYMVADNIGSPRRAVALWMHEQGLHTGLKELFGASYRQILNQVYLAAGGKKAFQDIAKRYDLNLDSRVDQIKAAEEYLANLAEKVSEGHALEGKEIPVWRRVVKAIAAWLRKMGVDLKLTDSEIAWIVNESIRATVYGEQMAEGEAGLSPAVAFALNDDVDPDREVEIVDLSDVKPFKIKGMDAKEFVKMWDGAPLSIRVNEKGTLDVSLFKGDKDHPFWSGRQGKARFSAARRRALKALDRVLDGTFRAESNDDVRKVGNKSQVGKIHRFYVPVSYGDQTALLRIVAFENEGRAAEVEGVELYDVITEHPRPAALEGGATVRGVPLGENSLTKKTLAEGPDAHQGSASQPKLKIKIRDLLKGVKGVDGSTYFSLADSAPEGRHVSAEEAIRAMRAAAQGKTVEEIYGAPNRVEAAAQAEAERTSEDALDDVEKTRSFATRLFELRDHGIYQANRMTNVLQQKIQRLAGSVRKHKGVFAYTDVKDSAEARALDQAMMVARDVGNNPEKVQEFREWAEAKLADPATSRKDRTKIKKQIEIVDQAMSLTGEQREFLANEIEDAFAEVGRKAKAAGIVRELRDNYVRRIWDFPKDAQITGVASNHGFKVFTTASKQRTLDTILDGWMAEYELKVNSLSNSFDQIATEIASIEANKAFIKVGRETVDSTGQPLFTTSKVEGYEPLKASGFSVWTVAGNVKLTREDGDMNPFLLEVNNYGQKVYLVPPKGGAKSATVFEKKQLNAPKELAAMLNKMTQGDNLFRETPGLDTLLRLNAGLKGWILLSSFFHHMAGARSWMFGVSHGFKDGKWNPVKAYKAGLDKIAANHALVSIGVRNGLTLGLQQDYDEGLLQQKGLTEKLMEKLGSELGLKAVEAGRSFREMASNSLFKKFFAGLKAEAFSIEYVHELQRNPGADPDQVAEKVARLINEDFGGLHLKRMGRNATLQKVSRLLLLAPDWTESNFRAFFGQAPGDKLNKWINKMIGDVPPPPGMTKIYRRFWTRVAVRAVLTTVMAQLLINGRSEDDRDDLIEFYRDQFSSWDMFSRMRWTMVDMTKLYRALGMEIPEGQRKMFSIAGHFTDPIKLANPAKLIKGKGSPVVRVADSAFTGSDWAERPYTGIEEFYKTGKTVKKSRFGEKEAFFNRLPAMVVNQIVSMQPIQVGHLIRYWQGEEDGLSALMSSAGAHVSNAWAVDQDKEQYQETAHRFNVARGMISDNKNYGRKDEEIETLQTEYAKEIRMMPLYKLAQRKLSKINAAIKFHSRREQTDKTREKIAELEEKKSEVYAEFNRRYSGGNLQ